MPEPNRDTPADYELIDAGEGRRLERFGSRVVDRPAPTATGRRLGDLLTWRRAELRFDGRTGWFGEPEARAPWVTDMAGVRLELRPGAAGNVGAFPEQLSNRQWLDDRIRQRPGCALLNLFAHTGLATLLAARAGAAVTHVDAARATVAWARRNATLSGLDAAPIRWIVDDAVAFIAREARRGRRYDGVILDPPSFGRAGSKRWRLVDGLPALLRGCGALLGDDPFVLLTAHTTGVDGHALAEVAKDALGVDAVAAMTVVPTRLQATSGARLELGWAVRLG